jgi:hypothetical protein
MTKKEAEFNSKYKQIMQTTTADANAQHCLDLTPTMPMQISKRHKKERRSRSSIQQASAGSGTLQQRQWLIAERHKVS